MNTDFSKGGWVYIDVVPDSIYSPQQADSMIGDEPFVKRYAARIPILKKDADGKFVPRTLFAPVLFPVLKAGGIVVATMPLLRSKELTTIIDCAEISHAFCDNELAEEMELVKSTCISPTSGLRFAPIVLVYIEREGP